jgi:hypothetical protein
MTGKNPLGIDEYTAVALKLYLQLPETPLKPSLNDKRTAETLYARGISISILESALLLASSRRLARSPDMPALSPIRSLAYFLPVIEEMLVSPIPDNYLGYLRRKLKSMSGRG